jgi:hypothetical protein
VFLFNQWRQVQEHPVSFHLRQQFYFSVFRQLLCKLQEDDLSLFFISDGPSAEVNIGLHLVAFIQEFDGMFYLEVKIMIVCIRAETYFLDDLLALLCL